MTQNSSGSRYRMNPQRYSQDFSPQTSPGYSTATMDHAHGYMPQSMMMPTMSQPQQYIVVNTPYSRGQPNQLYQHRQPLIVPAANSPNWQQNQIMDPAYGQYQNRPHSFQHTPQMHRQPPPMYFPSQSNPNYPQQVYGSAPVGNSQMPPQFQQNSANQPPQPQKTRRERSIIQIKDPKSQEDVTEKITGFVAHGSAPIIETVPTSSQIPVEIERVETGPFEFESADGGVTVINEEPITEDRDCDSPKCVSVDGGQESSTNSIEEYSGDGQRCLDDFERTPIIDTPDVTEHTDRNVSPVTKEDSVDDIVDKKTNIDESVILPEAKEVNLVVNGNVAEVGSDSDSQDPVASKLDKKTNIKKYNYVEDQWSPLNPEGKRKYDREFLFQFATITEKPTNLPQIEELGISVKCQRNMNDYINIPTGLENTGASSTNRRQAMGSRDFAPAFMGNSPRLDPRRDPRMRPGGHMGGNKSRETKRIIPMMNPIDTVKLKESENAWKPNRKKDTTGISEEDVDTEKVLKEVKGILNKLTPQKFVDLCKQMIEIPFKTQFRLGESIKVIYEKAISEPTFSVSYASLCWHMKSISVSTREGDSETKVEFRKVLLNLCQQEFEKEKDFESKFEERQKKIEDAVNLDEKKRLKAEFEMEQSKAKRRSLGNIRFIGELFKLQMLTEKIMHSCISKLLDSREDEENLECLCGLLATIGKELESKTRDKSAMDGYFNKFNDIVDKKRVSSRIRFRIQDVIELRGNKWVPRRSDNNPKTITEIHREFKEEQMQVKQQTHESVQRKRDQHNEPRKNKPSHDEGGWNTVANTKVGKLYIDLTKMQVSSNANSPYDSVKLGGSRRQWSMGITGRESKQESTHVNRYEPMSDSNRQRGSNYSDRPRASDRQFRNANSRDDEMQSYRKDRKHLQQVKSNIGHTASPSSSPGTSPKPSPYPSRDASPSLSGSGTITSKQVPLTDDELNTKIVSVLKEFYHQRDIAEAKVCFSEFIPPGKKCFLVQSAVVRSLEGQPKDRELLCELLNNFLESYYISKDDYITGFQKSTYSAFDLEIDVPMIWTNFADVLFACVIKEECVARLTLLPLICKRLIHDNKAKNVVSAILLILSKRFGHVDVKSMWNQSSLSWDSFFPPGNTEEDILSFLEGNNVLFTHISSDAPPSPISPVSKNVVDEFGNELDRLLEQDSAQNESIFDLVDNTKKQFGDSEKLFPVLFMKILSHSVSGDYLNVEYLKNRSNILKKYIDNEKEMELLALNTLQTLLAQLQWPPNLAKNICEVLYDVSVIPSESFTDWKNSLSNSLESDVKCRSEVESFFQYLHME